MIAAGPHFGQPDDRRRRARAGRSCSGSRTDLVATACRSARRAGTAPTARRPGSWRAARCRECSSLPSMSEIELDTPSGRARLHNHLVDRPVATVVLGHGAGGGVGAADLAAATKAATSAQVSVVLVEQPYRVAGRRSPAPTAQLDAAWIAIVEHLRDSEPERLPMITGGRAAGGRGACRTAA